MNLYGKGGAYSPRPLLLSLPVKKQLSLGVTWIGKFRQNATERVIPRFSDLVETVS